MKEFECKSTVLLGENNKTSTRHYFNLQRIKVAWPLWNLWCYSIIYFLLEHFLRSFRVMQNVLSSVLVEWGVFVIMNRPFLSFFNPPCFFPFSSVQFVQISDHLEHVSLCYCSELLNNNLVGELIVRGRHPHLSHVMSWRQMDVKPLIFYSLILRRSNLKGK